MSAGELVVTSGGTLSWRVAQSRYSALTYRFFLKGSTAGISSGSGGMRGTTSASGAAGGPAAGRGAGVASTTADAGVSTGPDKTPAAVLTEASLPWRSI